MYIASSHFRFAGAPLAVGAFASDAFAGDCFVGAYSCLQLLHTDGSKSGDRVGSAVVTRYSAKTFRLPNKASIFRAELYAISQAMDLIRRSKDTKFVIFSDSMSSLEATTS